jgi:hypothetical protein
MKIVSIRTNNRFPPHPSLEKWIESQVQLFLLHSNAFVRKSFISQAISPLCSRFLGSMTTAGHGFPDGMHALHDAPGL